ncbi:MAG: hypothetical protein OJF62_002520 [Pseudolabrys sp.]|nr:hypothetical protein [Pseudolabrys sp.]
MNARESAHSGPGDAMNQPLIGRIAALCLGAAVLFGLQYRGADIYLTIIAGALVYVAVRAAFALLARPQQPGSK